MDGTTKADTLAGKLREVLDTNVARVTRPTTMGELRIWNFDDSISLINITNEISIMGDCDEHLVKLAAKIADANKLKIGWTVSRVQLLAAKPIQCFKCWRFGHVRTTCNFPENRSGACFRCGDRDHQIGACQASPCCVLCKDAGKNSNHRLGSVDCYAINLNRSREAQDLLVHHSEEIEAAVCVVSEPARASSSLQNWFYSHDKLAAIFVLICGDFNAHAQLWGSQVTDARGDLLEDFAAQLDLRFKNVGNRSTFVGHRGISIIDLTWASSDLSSRITRWSVREDVESLSDHLYISFCILSSPVQQFTPPLTVRWNYKKMDTELYQEAIEWRCAVTPKNPEYFAAVEYDRWIHKCITDACDAAVPRLWNRRAGKSYWWSDAIAQLRISAISARRAWTRGKGRNRPEILETKRMAYIAASQNLKFEIRRAKSLAWQELVHVLDDDPWGLPYKLVMGKLRKPTTPLSVSLEPDILSRLLNKLFPPGRELIPVDLGDCEEGRTPIMADEVIEAIRAKKNAKTAPGPDGFKATVLNKLPSSMVHRLALAYDHYMRTFGSPMGSPLSPIGADIVMQDLEERALELLSFTPPFYERYVDDIAMAIPSTECTHTLEVFNSFHPRLQFTMEVGVDGRLNFLEITMIRTENRLQFDWFHKSTFSGKYLNFCPSIPIARRKEQSFV
ncbi:uncharacterized protein [Temnothorax longispinosus]|uniref:uncharacterized protein n=1 Tax=Temnothorax longispinosus TaxID=300112 RepID=UPI003A98FC2B